MAVGGVMVALSHTDEAQTRHQHQQVATKEPKAKAADEGDDGNDIHEGEGELGRHDVGSKGESVFSDFSDVANLA